MRAFTTDRRAREQTDPRPDQATGPSQKKWRLIRTPRQSAIRLRMAACCSARSLGPGTIPPAMAPPPVLNAWDGRLCQTPCPSEA
jgi:hypothetical protein